MSKANPAVSVIIPNYNHAQYIHDAITSVLNQRYRNFEVIVVDDGSTDNSRDVVAQFGDQVKYIYKQNAGLSAARNTGIEQAQGTFIGLLDADDMYEPDFMNTLVPILYSDSDAEAAYCGYQFVDEANQPLPQKEARSIPPADLFQVLAEGNFLVPESILVRKRCYQKVGLFDLNLRACEDVDMWLRISRQYKVLGVTNLLTRHRILPNSMSTDPSRQTENRLAVMRKHFGSKPLHESDWIESQRRAYGQAYLASSIEYLQARMYDRAYESFYHMAVVSPLSLTQLNTYYELGCGEQPKGYRGDFASLNLNASSQNLMKMLNQLFLQIGKQKGYRQIRNEAYSQANMALGLLYYGARRFSRARKLMLRAAIYNGSLLFNRRFATTFVKSFIDAGVIEMYHKRRRQSESVRLSSFGSKS